MKASELIKHLQNCIAKYGDLETEVVAAIYHPNKCADEITSGVNSIRIHVTPEYETFQIYWDTDYDENGVRKE